NLVDVEVVPGADRHASPAWGPASRDTKLPVREGKIVGRGDELPLDPEPAVPFGGNLRGAVVRGVNPEGRVGRADDVDVERPGHACALLLNPNAGGIGQPRNQHLSCQVVIGQPSTL